MSRAEIETVALNYVGGEWHRGKSSESVDVFDPATSQVLARVPLADHDDVAAAVTAAAAAFPGWRRTPPQDRVQYLFRFKQLLEQHADEVARLTTQENGKTFAESRAELQRGIENVEVACGIPTLMQGYNLEDVASGIDEIMIRQPLGVTAAITPSNFPTMIPLWFLPYAIACGNTFILKPSERVPLSATPPRQTAPKDEYSEGRYQLGGRGENRGRRVASASRCKSDQLVGSTPVAKYIYAQGAANGKRVQCQGGAKNYVVIMPDADLDMSAKVVNDSAFGCAGQRCLAVSAAITVGDASARFTDAIVDLASKLRVGNGLEDGIQMGPVISKTSKTRIQQLIEKGLNDGGKVILDGRNAQVKGGEGGAFLNPTILADIDLDNELTSTEIFGPVLALQSAKNLDEAIEIISTSAYGNAASIFTSNGNSARKFRYEVPTDNVGVNIGVAAPMAYFPFSGWKSSFFGVLHGQGRDGIEFYTDKKVVIERWPNEWSRKF